MQPGAISGIIVTIMQVRICPQCHSYDVHRSRRKGFVERVLLPMILKRPYRCDGCNERFYGHAYARPLAVPEPPEPKELDRAA